MISDLCIKYDVVVIADEVYEWLTYDNKKHIKIGEFFFVLVYKFKNWQFLQWIWMNWNKFFVEQRNAMFTFSPIFLTVVKTTLSKQSLFFLFPLTDKGRQNSFSFLQISALYAPTQCHSFLVLFQQSLTNGPQYTGQVLYVHKNLWIYISDNIKKTCNFCKRHLNWFINTYHLAAT